MIHAITATFLLLTVMLYAFRVSPALENATTRLAEDRRDRDAREAKLSQLDRQLSESRSLAVRRQAEAIASQEKANQLAAENLRLLTEFRRTLLKMGD